MTQKTNTLPKDPRIEQAEMDRMSKAAFAGYGSNKPHMYDWAKDEKDGHFIERPQLPAEKPVELFLAELAAATGYQAGRVATGNVVSIDVKSIGAEVQIPVHIQHSDVA